MNENLKWGAAAVAVVGLSVGAVVYFSHRDKVAPPAPPVAAKPVPQPALPEEPAIKHPLPESAAPEPLPPLNESDVPMQNALAALIGMDGFERFVVPTDLARHFVVAVDNLSEQKVAERIRPLKPTAGAFAVAGPDEAPVLNPANYERYQPLVQLFRSTDTQRLVDVYTRNYPLFQEAYESLGHPPQYFNDRLIEVIDLLLATPDVKDPIALAQPGVLYEFADPKLESLSAGQKVLIRMGSENAKAVKDKLREVRGVLATKPPGQ
jgi:hypothetical protein